jgi:hypothetical protein
MFSALVASMAEQLQEYAQEPLAILSYGVCGLGVSELLQLERLRDEADCMIVHEVHNLEYVTWSLDGTKKYMYFSAWLQLPSSQAELCTACIRGHAASLDQLYTLFLPI